MRIIGILLLSALFLSACTPTASSGSSAAANNALEKKNNAAQAGENVPTEKQTNEEQNDGPSVKQTEGGQVEQKQSAPQKQTAATKQNTAENQTVTVKQNATNSQIPTAKQTTGEKQNQTLTTKQAEDLVRAQLNLQPDQNVKVEYDHDASNGDYIIHVYEFVVDNPSTGDGHTVTLGWYGVNKQTKKVYNMMQ